MAKQIVKLGGILCLITFLVTAILAGANRLTAQKIAENAAAVAVNMRREIIDADTYEELPDGVYRALRGGETLGYCVDVTAPGGYGGNIGLIVGIYPDGSVAGVRVVSHSETAGLGAKAATPAFTDQFVGKDEVYLNSESKHDGIDAISGATRTSRAVVGGVTMAQELLHSAGLTKE